MIVAEALAAVDDAQAPAAFGALANGRVAADAKRALARLDARARGLGQMAGDAVGLPGGLLAGPADDAVAAARLAVTDLFDAARGGNWTTPSPRCATARRTRAPPARRRCTRPR